MVKIELARFCCKRQNITDDLSSIQLFVLYDTKVVQLHIFIKADSFPAKGFAFKTK